MLLFKSILATACVLALSSFGYADEAFDMRCKASPNEELMQMRKAPHSAKRLDTHRLEIGWTNGTHIFADEPPYDEPGEGMLWRYCGYSPLLKLHLISMADPPLFTGVLLDDTTGAVLPGGETVLFSPNKQFYLVYEQEWGRDGENIILYTRTGSLQWKGYNGITTPNDLIVAYFEDMKWTEQNQLQAKAVRSDGKGSTQVTLTKNKNGTWEWLPRLAP